MEETLSTLNYAQRANAIKNKATSNIKMMSNGYPAAAGAGGGGGGVSMADWNEAEAKLQYMEAQVEEAHSALGRKHAQMQEAIEKVDVLQGQVPNHTIRYDTMRCDAIRYHTIRYDTM